MNMNKKTMMRMMIALALLFGVTLASSSRISAAVPTAVSMPSWSRTADSNIRR